MKEHILRECINDLRDIAANYHAHQCLREMIKSRLLQAFHDDAEWYRAYEAAKTAPPINVPDMRLHQPGNKDYMVKL